MIWKQGRSGLYNIGIKRRQDDKAYQENFSVDSHITTLLSALYEIKSLEDASLTFSAGCRSGICGSCAVLVNGKEALACAYRPKDGDIIEPLRYHKVIRDLKVDKTKALATLGRAKAWLKQVDTKMIPNKSDEEATQKQSDCILCDSCFSACPVLAVNEDFLGPFALTRAYRYGSDSRELDNAESIKSIQTNGIWDCTLCGECTLACPQGIDPKMDITMLRTISAQQGYTDPNFGAMSFTTPNFGGGFGF